MRPIRIGGRRVICPICKRRYATAHVFGTITCGKCLRALFIGFMTGKNSALDEIYRKYELKKGVERMSGIRYQWRKRVQIEFLPPIRIRSEDLEHIEKLLIIPVIEETPERGETEGDEVI